MGEDLVHLNVGGTLYLTTTHTLAQYPDSMLGAMFNGSLPTARDKNGCYFIDRDGEVFRYILNYLRSSRLSLPVTFTDYDLLLTEADFYQIKPLIQEIIKQKEQESQNNGPKTHEHLLEIIEVRVGSIPTMPTNNSRVKTILSGQKNVILTLPVYLVGDDGLEKLQKKSSHDFTELELNGSNIRLKLGEYLKNSGWILADSNMSSSSGYDVKSLISNLIIEQSYRDRWCKTATSECLLHGQSEHDMLNACNESNDTPMRAIIDEHAFLNHGAGHD